MKSIETPIPGLIVIEPDVYGDIRGYFFETYQKNRYSGNGVTVDFIQDNESKSSFGVIRGLHYQLNPYSQSKLVRVIEGSVFDVAVDIRVGSPTFGKWFGIELSAENHKQMFIPSGFAHGFSVLSPTAIFVYKCDNLYHRDSERAINLNDPFLDIDWRIDKTKQVISEKDLIAPSFKDAELNFTF